jgi:hypothetical protein
VDVGLEGFRYLVDTEAFAEDGLPGQNQLNPKDAFDVHFVVKYNSKYYDPSYGTGPFDTPKDWENASLAGFILDVIDIAIVPPRNEQWVRKLDPIVMNTVFEESE